MYMGLYWGPSKLVNIYIYLYIYIYGFSGVKLNTHLRILPTEGCIGT